MSSPSFMEHLLNPVLPSTQHSAGSSSSYAAAPLKRRASQSFEDAHVDGSRKRAKEEDHEPVEETESAPIDGEALADDLEQELQCGCCSALVYRPVVVSPCQHFFCGSCCVMWVRNGGTNCPACRSISTAVNPSRTLQALADVLVRAAPNKARSAIERIQADEVYKAGMVIRIPAPRQASPEPTVPQNNGNFVMPCPHCVPGNPWHWRCPQPIVDPEIDPDNAWVQEDGTPPGHGYCGNCENILALNAPTTTRCDLCLVSFCGVGIPGRCVAAPLAIQQPQGLTDIGDLIQCSDVYECFDSNTVEVDIMLDYLTTNRLSPRHIYREVVSHIMEQPRQFAPLIELELFLDVHSVAGSVDPNPNAPRENICRLCAAEVLLWGLREWWVRERSKGYLMEAVTSRPDCPEGSGCTRQKDHAHAKEYNHIIGASTSDPQPVGLQQARAVPATWAASSGSSSGERVVLPPMFVELDLLPGSSHASHRDDVAPSSQDFRDEVDALL